MRAANGARIGKRRGPPAFAEVILLGGIIVSSGNIEEKVLDCALKINERIQYRLRKLLTAMRCPTLGLATNLEPKNVKPGCKLAIKALSAAQTIGDNSDRGN